ncbi:MAG: UDP-N-acetylglucosamine 1-carboxyvinyltransferase [Acetobacteraceae bacterium]|nr:UDP-N-acetylglucosamine 1-carboxyvinyltransferase [Acetobacteraceae bacterium]
MDRIAIRGGRPLCGSIPIGGAKNAALPLMAAALLSDEQLTLTNVPWLADIASMAALLAQHGLAVDLPAPETAAQARVLRLGGAIQNTTAPYDIVRKMRASILVLGPILARCGEARVSLPGGCAIGTRPVDLHLKGLEAMGASVSIEGGYIHARSEGRLRGASIVSPAVSVGATENLMMAASLADGHTTLINAAREPEISDLAECLNAMGGRIRGHGSERIEIEGVQRLSGTTHHIIPDRIETGTYAIATAIAGGDVMLEGGRIEHLGAFATALSRAGVDIFAENGGIRVRRNGHRVRGADIMTEPYPGFPTDLQAQFMALMATAEGAAMITETIFENRFMHVPELARMGADIVVHNASAIVRGVKNLSGAPVMATDLRASVSLVLAGLAAGGETIVNRVYHLDRGYERVEAKLAACGADIERLAG